MVRALIYSSMYAESLHSPESIAQLLSHPTVHSLPHLTALLPPSLLCTAPYSSSLPCTAISLLSSLEAVPVPMVSSGAAVVESTWRPGGSCGPISIKDPARVEEARLWLVMSPSSMSSSGTTGEAAGGGGEVGLAGGRGRGAGMVRRGGG